MTLMTPCPRYKFGGTPDKRAWAPDKRAWACRNVGMGMTKSACVTKTHAHARSCPFALGHARLACRKLNSLRHRQYHHHGIPCLPLAQRLRNYVAEKVGLRGWYVRQGAGGG